MNRDTNHLLTAMLIAPTLCFGRERDHARAAEIRSLHRRAGGCFASAADRLELFCFQSRIASTNSQPRGGAQVAFEDDHDDYPNT